MSAPAPGVTERKGYIGGSDAAGILSLSPYATPFQVFAQKVGAEIAQAPDPVREEKFEWGHALEAAIAKGFQRRTGLEVRRSPEPFYRHPKYSFMGAHLDFQLALMQDGRVVIVECKNVEFLSLEWGEPNELNEDSSSLVPLYYLAQCDHYMIVRDASHAFLCALFGGCKLRIYRINRSPERERLLIAAEAAFWKRVVEDDPPPFSGPDDLIAAMQSGYIKTYNAERAKKEKIRIELDAVAKQLMATVGLERKRERAAKKNADVARLALVQHLAGKTGYLYAEKEKCGSFLMQRSESFDEFSFKLQHPEIHSKFVKESIYGPVLRLTKDKEEEDGKEKASPSPVPAGGNAPSA